MMTWVVAMETARSGQILIETVSRRYADGVYVECEGKEPENFG